MFLNVITLYNLSKTLSNFASLEDTELCFPGNVSSCLDIQLCKLFAEIISLTPAFSYM